MLYVAETVNDDVRLESHLFQDSYPIGPGEETLHMSVPTDRYALAFPEEVRIVHQVRRVGGIRIPRPLEVAKSTTVAVVPPVTGPFSERFPGEVRCDDGDAARPAVYEERLERSP